MRDNDPAVKEFGYSQSGTVWLLSPFSVLFRISIAFLATSICLHAQETVADHEPPESDSQQPVEVADNPADDELNRAVADSVRSMFQEKETPYLHIRWGTKVYVDAPLDPMIFALRTQWLIF